MARDQLAALAQLILAVTGAVVVLASWAERRRDNHAEYYALLAAAGAGMVFFVEAENLMTLFLGLEWFSLCLYILVAHRHRTRDLARGRPQVPHRRRLRIGGAPVRLGARLRSDRRAELLTDRHGGDDAVLAGV